MVEEVHLRDRQLVQIVDAAMAEAARLSGEWLVCRPGCAECCLGPFRITPLDALRLRRGLAELAASDSSRAARVVERARAYAGGDDEPCPALDPAGLTCELYAARPITCRVFGPPARVGSEACGVCELCYHGATDEEIAQCEVEIDPEGIEVELLDTMKGEETTVAAALAG